MKHFYRKFAQLGVLMLTVVALYLYSQRQLSAEAAFLASLPTTATATTIQFQGLHTAPSNIGNFLFYSVENAKSGSIETSYVPVKRNIWGQWRVGTSGHCSQNGVDRLITELADFHAHHLWLPYDYNSMTDYSLVCGQVNSEAIRSIAVRWQDGTMTQDRVAEGRFVVLVMGLQPACELQLFDGQNKLMQAIDLRHIEFVSTDATTLLPKCKSL